MKDDGSRKRLGSTPQQPQGGKRRGILRDVELRINTEEIEGIRQAGFLRNPLQQQQQQQQQQMQHFNRFSPTGSSIESLSFLSSPKSPPYLGSFSPTWGSLSSSSPLSPLFFQPQSWVAQAGAAPPPLQVRSSPPGVFDYFDTHRQQQQQQMPANLPFSGASFPLNQRFSFQSPTAQLADHKGDIPVSNGMPSLPVSPVLEPTDLMASQQINDPSRAKARPVPKDDLAVLLGTSKPKRKPEPKSKPQSPKFGAQYDHWAKDLFVEDGCLMLRDKSRFEWFLERFSPSDPLVQDRIESLCENERGEKVNWLCLQAPPSERPSPLKEAQKWKNPSEVVKLVKDCIKQVARLPKTLKLIRKSEYDEMLSILLDLAVEINCLHGKWVLTPSIREVDALWKLVGDNFFSGKLGSFVRVSIGEDRTERFGHAGFVVCIYIDDFRDREAAQKVIRTLLEPSFKEYYGKFPFFKPDFLHSKFGFHSGNMEQRRRAISAQLSKSWGISTEWLEAPLSMSGNAPNMLSVLAKLTTRPRIGVMYEDIVQGETESSKESVRPTAPLDDDDDDDDNDALSAGRNSLLLKNRHLFAAQLQKNLRMLPAPKFNK